MKNYQSKYKRGLSREKLSNEDQLLESFDFRKLFILFKKSLIWVFIIFTIGILSVIFYKRYTNDKFSSSAELKLNKRNEASLFGFPKVTEESSNIGSLSGEVELIRSKLFLKEVVKELPLDVTYEVIGRFKNEERYKLIPFILKYDDNCAQSINRFYVDIISNQEFKITDEIESNNWIAGRFDEFLNFKGCKIQLEKTSSFFFDETVKITLNTEEQLLDYIGSNLQVAPENLNANTIKIEFSDYNPHKVQSIVSAISELYIVYSKEQKNQANELKINFLNSQLEDIETILSNFEGTIEKFTLENKTANPDKDLSMVIRQLTVIDSSIFNLKQQRNKLLAIQADLAKDSIELNIFNNIPTTLIKKISAYAEINKELKLAKTKYKSQSQIIKQLETSLRIERQDIESSLLSSLEYLNEQLNNLVQRKNQVTQKFVQLPGKANELNQKMRFYAIYESLYLSLMQKKTEFQIAKAGSVAEVVILTPANLPKTPIGPKNVVLFIGALIICFIASLLLLLIRYFLNDEINSLNELERLTNLPIVGSINKVRSSVAKKIGVMVFEKPRAQISENFRSLRTGLNFMSLNQKRKVIAVTSSISGEGKTFIAVNLAAVISLSNRKTIILDLDLRKPRAQYAFNIEKSDEGISAILCGNANWRDCIHKTQNENLHLIPSGEIPPNPAELLESNYFSELLAELKEIYDVIILDTPPVGLVSDGIIALKKADQSLFIVRSDYSRRSFIKDLHRDVELNSLSNISLVFNAVSKRKDGHGYYQDYYEDNTSTSGFNLKKLLNLG